MSTGSETEAKGRGVPRAARGRAVRDPEPVGRGLGARARRARLRGARDDELRASPSRSGGSDGARDARRGRRARAACSIARRELPVSVDLENGYGESPESAALAIRRVAEAGAVGGSIEDYDPSGRALRARRSRRSGSRRRSRRHEALDFPFTLTARAENHIRGNPDLDDTIARLQAFEAAGADVLYAPGLRTTDEIRAVCDAVGKPVNVLAHRGLTLAEIVDAGAQRVSVGGALTWVAVGAFARAAEAIRDRGDFSVLDQSLPLGDWLG